jgi:hypothetical protein
LGVKIMDSSPTEKPSESPRKSLGEDRIFTQADEQYLAETLIECKIKLEFALQTAQEYRRLSDLATAICDALTGCQEALAIVNDPQAYLE